MIKCPYCNGTDWKFINRHPVDPAKDRLVCKPCNKKFTRYQSRDGEQGK